MKNLRLGPMRNFCMVALFLAVFFLPSTACAEADAERISQVKAAFILNIARFVAWPPETLDRQNDRLLLCLYRSNPFGEAIVSIEGEAVSGRRLETTAIRNLAESAPCNILLIAAGELKNYAEDTQPDTVQPMLIIVDKTDDEAPKEPTNIAIVTLVRNGSRIGFEINLEKSLQAGLKMSSKLLRLAKIVGGDS